MNKECFDKAVHRTDRHGERRKEKTRPGPTQAVRFIHGPMAHMVALLLLFSGCSYSFRGGTVPPHLSTIAIPVLNDVSGYGDPSLRERFTQELTQLFITDASLDLSDRNTADSILEGTIVEVRDAPNVLQGGEQVAQRRITVRVRMTFNDLKLRKEVWQKDFTNYGDYPSGGGLTQRQEGIDEAIRKLVEDILNETVAGW